MDEVGGEFCAESPQLQLSDGYPLDPEIAPVVSALNTPYCRTTSSCSGHGKEAASVEVIVKNRRGLQRLCKALNRADRDLGGDIWVDLKLTFYEGIGYCMADCRGTFPLSIEITELRRHEASNDAPSPDALRRFATALARYTSRVPVTEGEQ